MFALLLHSPGVLWAVLQRTLQHPARAGAGHVAAVRGLRRPVTRVQVYSQTCSLM